MGYAVLEDHMKLPESKSYYLGKLCIFLGSRDYETDHAAVYWEVYTKDFGYIPLTTQWITYGRLRKLLKGEET